MDKVAGSGNDEFYTPAYAIEPIVRRISEKANGEKWTIWLPFDRDESLFVKAFKEAGFEVVNTHIDYGQDFFEMEPPECQAIVSNPPYSKKTEVFERLFEIGKPFAMLVGVVGLFESQRRFDMFRTHDFECMYLNRRVSYFKDYADEKPSLNPPFSSIYMCSGLLPQQIVFEEIDKNGGK